jgi:polyphenol oxidase
MSSSGMTGTSWSVDANGFHVDSRMAEAGFAAGVTTKAMGDMADAVARARSLDLAGLGHLPSYDLKQIHGNVIHDLVSAASSPSGDGFLVYDPGRVALVYAADCMPIFVWDGRGKAAVVLHSGWKGTKANIAGEGVKALVARGVKPALACAAIGPRIGACCYAVGDDFWDWARPGSLERRGGKLYFDMAAEATAQLTQAGLPLESISLSPACTACGEGFFSFRRDKQSSRMMGFLARRHG